MPGMGSRIQARPLSRPRPMRREGRPSSSSRHEPGSAALAARRPPSDCMPPLSATVSPSRGAGKHRLFNALPTSRPARTGPSADSEQPIALGVNFDKGVYVVRQLTPPLPALRSAAIPPPPLTRPLHRRQLEPGAGSRDLRRASRLFVLCEFGSQGDLKGVTAAGRVCGIVAGGMVNRCQAPAVLLLSCCSSARAAIGLQLRLRQHCASNLSLRHR